MLLVLTGTTIAGFLGWKSANDHVAQLEQQMATLQEKEREQAVVRSISSQMEEIALAQKEISDQQREEAIEQRHVAEQMRQQSEEERAKALAAQDAAIASEQQAQQARHVAEEERLTAEHQRIKAEFSKRVADTLSYIALGRSLGSLAMVQAQAGNKELSELLAYASYAFTSRYGGDVYQPAVFQALMTASQSMRSWPRHNGAAMALQALPGHHGVVFTASSYGEVMRHVKQGNQLLSASLLNDNSCDFRSLYATDEGTVYVVSRTGQLVIINHGVTRYVPLPTLEHPMMVTPLGAKSLLLIGEHAIAEFDTDSKTVVSERNLNINVTAACRYQHCPMLFDDHGQMHLVRTMQHIETSRQPVSGRVTAFASSNNAGICAYGMSDGTIYVVNEDTGQATKLPGHLSRISRLKFVGTRLLSSSYDHTLKLWHLSSGKIEPMTLVTGSSWLMDFTLDESKNYAWIGDQQGNLTEALMSVTSMADMVKGRLHRDFTAEEWDYYIGRNIPFESFK